MIEQTLSQLRQLKRTGMAGALQTQQEQPGTYQGLAFAERLQLLVDQESHVASLKRINVVHQVRLDTGFPRLHSRGLIEADLRAVQRL